MADSASQATQSRADLDETWQRGFEWLEKNLSARILSFERQARWRPAFFVEAERAGEPLSLYLRGERGALDHGVYTLEHESRVLQVLESEGLPVPHVYGFCPDPKMIVMDRMPGRVDLSTAESEDERVQVLDHFMDLLADLHSIDPRRFEEIGIERPRDAVALGLGDLDRWEKAYRDSKVRPDPMTEFLSGWVQRNVPMDREDVSCLQVDAGQFLFENGRVTSFLDLEVACLGDPAADLAGMRGRDLTEPLGDLEPAFERYFARTGKRISKKVIDYHTVRFCLLTPYACGPIVANPPDTIDLVVYLSWYWVWSRSCVEVIADGAGISLHAPDIPQPKRSPYASAHDLLVDKLESLSKDAEGFLSYELDMAWRNSLYLSRVESIWPEMQREEADEIDKLLGRVSKPTDRESEFEAFVLEHGATREEELLQFFQKRCLRQEALMGSAMQELEGVQMQLLR